MAFKRWKKSPSRKPPTKMWDKDEMKVVGWCLQNKDVSTVILGASNPDQLKQNLKTVNYLEKFDDSVMKKINEIIS